MLIASGPDPTAPTVLRSSESLAVPSLDFTPASLAARFRQVLSPAPTPTSQLLGTSSPRFLKLPVGTRIEVSPASFKIARQIGELLHDKSDSSEGAHTAGSALIIDYGGDHVYGNSFRVCTASLVFPIPVPSPVHSAILARTSAYAPATLAERCQKYDAYCVF